MKKEKIFNLILFMLIFLLVLSVILLNPLNNLDEIWNYNFARNICDGLIPYKDFNMLQMPLLPIICSCVLKIITNQLIVMRILAALLCSSILYLTYKIFKILNIRKEIAVLFTIIIGILFKDYYCIDYNFATLLATLLIIQNEIKLYNVDSKIIKNNIKIDFFLGLLAGLTITLKQSTGILICIALLENKLVFVRKKEEFKCYIKSFIYRLVGVIIPVILMVIYLFINGAFKEFINYTIIGVSSFSNYISYTKLIDLNLVGILSLLVPLTFIYAWIKCIIFGKDKEMFFLLVYGLAMFAVCFPISDNIHFLIGSVPALILILYKLYKFVSKKKFLKNENLTKLIIYFVLSYIILFLCYYTLINMYNYFTNIKECYSLKHYRYIPITKDLEKQIIEVDNYIRLSNIKVKILDASAAIYMIPVDKYNKNYDMLLKGNLGGDGESKIINEILKSTDIKYLVLKNKSNLNWQTPLNIIDCVKSNKIKNGELEIFDIYE